MRSRRVNLSESWIKRARPRTGDAPGGRGTVGGSSRMETAAPVFGGEH